MKNVITGASSSGKTTLLNELRNIGYTVFGEVARDILSNNNESNNEETQKAIWYKQLETEKSSDFMDRSLIDNLTFSEYFLGHTPEYAKDTDLKDRYGTVFFLSSLDFIDDGIRTEKDSKEADEIAGLIKDNYIKYGYNVIDVPMKSLDDRVNFIIDNTKIDS